VFKPAGIPATGLVEVVLGMDELEAIRLADADGLYHEQAAREMNVSRQTFGRIVSAARTKVAQALIEGKALRIDGGVVEMAEQRTFKCFDCQHAWQVPYGTGRPAKCPACSSSNIRRTDDERGARAGRCRQGGGGAGGGRGSGTGQGGGRGQGRKGGRGRGG
jgi:predicted DNA-binding protein (UPF0251 family)